MKHTRQIIQAVLLATQPSRLEPGWLTESRKRRRRDGKKALHRRIGHIIVAGRGQLSRTSLMVPPLQPHSTHRGWLSEGHDHMSRFCRSVCIVRYRETYAPQPEDLQ